MSDRVVVEEHAAGPPSTSAWCMHQLDNNAAVALSRSVLENGYGDCEWLFAVNRWGVIHSTKAFLPRLVASGDGRAINAH